MQTTKSPLEMILRVYKIIYITFYNCGVHEYECFDQTMYKVQFVHSFLFSPE